MPLNTNVVACLMLGVVACDPSETPKDDPAPPSRTAAVGDPDPAPSSAPEAAPAPDAAPPPALPERKITKGVVDAAAPPAGADKPEPSLAEQFAALESGGQPGAPREPDVPEPVQLRGPDPGPLSEAAVTDAEDLLADPIHSRKSIMKGIAKLETGRLPPRLIKALERAATVYEDQMATVFAMALREDEQIAASFSRVCPDVMVVMQALAATEETARSAELWDRCGLAERQTWFTREEVVAAQPMLAVTALTILADRDAHGGIAPIERKMAGAFLALRSESKP